MGEYFHSVTLDEAKCKGCTNCIKRCPTEAIRVRHGKARIINERCIDCGECIRICPYHAKKAITDDLSVIDSFKYKIAIPAPTIRTFKPEYSRNRILNTFCSIDSMMSMRWQEQQNMSPMRPESCCPRTEPKSLLSHQHVPQ